MSSIGVGFLDNHAEGLFHRQRLELMPGVFCRAGAGDESGAVLDDDQTSLVWTAADANLAGAKAVLAAGKQVLLGLPSEVTSNAWRQLTADSECSEKLFVAAAHRWDSRFLTVRSQLDRGDLGTLVEVRRISRQFVPGELSIGRNENGAFVSDPTELRDHERGVFHAKWFEMLDELLLLVPASVTSVWARTTMNGRCAWLSCSDGCQGYLELDLRSLAPLETGWILEGTRGGYAAGRRYRAADDYELIDVPVDELPTTQGAFYNSLLATLCTGEPFPVTRESIAQVLAVRDAIEASAQTGQGATVADHS